MAPPIPLDTRVRTRSQGTPSAMLRLQQINLESLLTQSARAKLIIERPADRKAGGVQVQRKIEALGRLWADFEGTHRDLAIIEDDPDVELYLKDDSFGQARTDYFELIEELEGMLDSPSQLPAGENNSQGTTQSTARHSPPTLARIPLPEFDGTLREWPNFRDQFVAMVVNDGSIADIFKFAYLKRALKGNALALVSNVEISVVGFPYVWKLVTDHYQNLNSLTFANIVRLLQLAPADSRKSGQLERLYLETREVVTSLKALKEPVDEWGSILVVLTVLRLDPDLRRDWEHSLGSQATFPTFTELEKFLQTRIQINSMSFITPEVTTHKASAAPSKSFNKQNSGNSKFNSHLSTNASPKCPLCEKSSHYARECDQLLKLDAVARLKRIQLAKLCANCLGKGHLTRDCKSNGVCKVCQLRHHSVLHDPAREKGRDTNDSQSNKETASTQISSHAATQVNSASQSKFTASGNVLLATATVKISSVDGGAMTARLLIDQGSERSFISEHAAQRLRLKRTHVNATIAGIGNSTPGRVNHSARIQVTSAISDNSIHVTCLILAKLTHYAPRHHVARGQWYHVSHLPLADAEMHSTRPIDLILGADVYGLIIRDGIMRFPREPLAQQTIFGWILTGPVYTADETNHEQNAGTVINSMHITSHDNLAKSLTKFWEIEDTPVVSLLTADERKCEELFTDTTTRDSKGRYTVHLPFASNLPLNIGDSHEIASKQYARLERRLSRDPELSKQYHAFLREYRDLGHMSEYAPRPERLQECYLPHHPVVRETSSTTKVRVVFNASCQTSNGHALNDLLLIGPKLQQDIVSIILRWRLHRYVMTADAEKMFRQILVTPEHRPYQLILWRPTANDPVTTYQLNTVTYGTACAPYLSLRVLYQLASDEAAAYPLAAKSLREDTYVDDLVFGASSITHARNIRDEILKATLRGGFSFRKWISNDPDLINDLPLDLRDSAKNKDFVSDEEKRILGISWRTIPDTFEYSIVPDKPAALTKRAILSTIAKLYDPLGWISPVVITAKICMQQLWTANVGWDETIPPTLLTSWSTFADDLSNITRVSIPRWINLTADASLQLHVFCDASQLAYAAAIYARIETNGKIITRLLVSKTKVAPLKSVTIPRLELCAAELGSRLLVWTQNCLDKGDITSFAWSDSSVTLAWLAAVPARWKVFVANRVSRIQTRAPFVPWRYVSTDSNPADIASRGCSAQELVDHDLWWYGPRWLRQPQGQWPSSAHPEPDQAPEQEARPLTIHVAAESTVDHSLRCSDWGRLIRSGSILFRYIAILKRKIRQDSVDEFIEPSTHTLFKLNNQSRAYWLREAQKTCFSSELKIIRERGNLPRRNRLIALNPYFDDKGILRVGGRLEHADLRNDAKHPVLLGHCHTTTLIIRQAHLRTLHGGVSLTSRLLAETYWIFRLKSIVKNEIRRCVQCARHRATTLSQEMAPLPSLRVNRRRAFDHVGVDYAGPISVKFGTGRGHQAHKAYIAVFVCMITRAVHLELVHAYTTEAFLAAFKSFSSRRGLPSMVVSDNGTNFNGASRELTREFTKAMSHPAIASTLALDKTEWRFIPPGSPHFGGMWEAGVKSVKHHLRRVTGDRTLSNEEFGTLLCQVEACLKSRPIAGFSSDPTDLSYLTPGHFLIGTALLAPPEPSLSDINEARLSRWQTVQLMAERFWRIWSSDYLRSLQTRVKWRSPQPTIEPGAIVLIKDENLPPEKWALGRVVHCHAGSDGHIRVCEIRTAVSSITRPITKLCLLPVDTATTIDEDRPVSANET